MVDGVLFWLRRKWKDSHLKLDPSQGAAWLAGGPAGERGWQGPPIGSADYVLELVPMRP
jgi:hypothetical protein